MSFLADFEMFVRDAHPDLETAQAADGSTLRIAEAGGLEDADAPEVHLHLVDGAVLLDWVWRLPVRDGRQDELRDFVVEYVRETFENHGWEVPVRLLGGPLNGKSLTKHREDLVGRLLFARPQKEPGDPHAGDLYKWRLKRNAQGEYLCFFERSLVGEELDTFIARGVDSTGPFVVIHGS